MKIDVEKLKQKSIIMRLTIDKTIERIKQEIEFWESEENNTMILETLNYLLGTLEGVIEDE